jgi:arylsulfatase A-like enzyme
MSRPSRRGFLKSAIGVTLATTMTRTASASGKPESGDPAITVAGPDDEPLRERCRRARAEDPRPNILLLFTDQQTISAMGCAGNPNVYTPHMDALARSGTRFVSSYCAAPICGPSRGSMITGQPPHRTGVIYNGDALPGGFPTLGSVLRTGGYYTAWTGKWHLPESFLREARDSHGFHHRPLNKDLPFVALGDQTDFLTAMDAEFFLRWEIGKQPKPWFLGVSLHNPHDICYDILDGGPVCANRETLPPLPANFAADPDEPHALKLRRENARYGHELARTKDWSEDRWREYLRTYAHLASQVDRAVGRVLRALVEGGWKENTLVIFTSDHGEGIAAHRWATKLSLYEESTCVPLILSLPGRFRPAVIDAPVSALDLLPTACDFSGATPPANLPGASLRPLLEGGCLAPDRPVVCELAADPDRPEIQGRMVRTSRFKYCAYTPGKPSEQLFDLAADPGETRDLARDPAGADTLRHHRSLLARWCTTTADPFGANRSGGGRMPRG